MQRLRSLTLGRRSLPFRLSFGAGVFGIAFALRYGLDHALPPGFPFLTFFPAVILTGFFASTGTGIVVAVAGALASWFFFIEPLNSWALTGPSVLALAFYIFIAATDLALIHAMRLALRKLEEERARSDRLAQQNKLMFHELQHRVSNNLQVMASLLKMQQRDVTDERARAALDTAAARLRVVASIQRQLHNPKRQATDIGQLLQAVLPEVIGTTVEAERVALQFDLGPLVVASDQATPVALIAVELVSNALEHALEAGGQVAIRVTAAEEGGEGVLCIADTGPGLPEDFHPGKSRSLGLRIAHLFTEQLGGSLDFVSDGGTRVTLRFPIGTAED